MWLICEVNNLAVRVENELNFVQHSKTNRILDVQHVVIAGKCVSAIYPLVSAILS